MKLQRETSHDIGKQQMVYDGFCAQHAGIDLATVANYLVDLASYVYNLYKHAEDIALVLDIAN